MKRLAQSRLVILVDMLAGVADWARQGGDQVSRTIATILTTESARALGSVSILGALWLLQSCAAPGIGFRTVGVPPSPLTINTSSLSNGRMQAPYQDNLVAGGGTTPYRWGIASGSFPPGLTLDISTGAITGAPTACGPHSFTVRVEDSAAPPQAATKAFTIILAVSGYCVSPVGSDSNDGAAENPWASIQHAARSVHAGDTVHVAPGTYFENVTTSTSGTASARITFVSDTKWGAQVKGDGGFLSIIATWQNLGNYVDIQGFDISGNVSIGIDNEASYAGMIGNHVHDLAVPCASTGGGGIVDGNQFPNRHDSDIIGNRIHDIGDLSIPDPCPYVHGIYQQVPGGHLWNNVIYRTAGYGIINAQRASSVVISNNLVFENKEGGIAMGTDFPNLVDSFVITNNIAVSNGIGVYEVDMLNNNPQQIGTHNRYVNNVAYRGIYGAIVLTPESFVEGTLTSNPRFVNYRPDGSGDYHLAPSSPCIGTGVAEGMPPYDFDGVPRPAAGPYDRGPYQTRP